MNLTEIIQQFVNDIGNTKWYEFVAVLAGIVSVWYSRKENILVYPIGLLNTIIYIYISFKEGLFGEATVNFYYTIMSILGWYWWLQKKDDGKENSLKITLSSYKEWVKHFIFFGSIYVIIFFSLTYLKQTFAPNAIPWADAFASATAFTGMWLMTKKKVESWHWWIATNLASMPLYFVKHYVFTSVYYLVLLIMAVFGLMAWLKKAKTQT